MTSPWRLWGTFSVADHLREHPFLADVMVYDRLVIPTPEPDDEARWVANGWQPDVQRTLIDILREGDGSRVLEVPWSTGTRDRYGLQDAFAAKKAQLAASVSFDVDNLSRVDPDTPAYYVTRVVLADYADADRDRRLLADVTQGLPPEPETVSVVAAYGSEEEFAGDADDLQEITQKRSEPGGAALPSELLGGFVWPFLVPAEPDRSDADLLRRAVEFANRDETLAYRRAFHDWRRDVVHRNMTPREAAEQLGDAIDAYGREMRRSKVETVAVAACAVVTITAGVAAALLPLLGLPVIAAYVGAGAALGPGVEPLATRLFRGKLRSDDFDATAGALFWQGSHALTS